MSEKLSFLSRRSALVAGLLLLLGAGGAVYAGIPKIPKQNGTQSGDQGPYGLPGLKKVTEACSLSHDQEQAMLRVYNDYKHKEHEEMQAKDKTSASSGKGDCVNAVKAVLTPDEQKKFDELLGESGKKKKKT